MFLGKRYNVADVSAALCMSLGLIWFTLADSKIAPNFNVTGTGLLLLKSVDYEEQALFQNLVSCYSLHNNNNNLKLNVLETLFSCFVCCF